MMKNIFFFFVNLLFFVVLDIVFFPSYVVFYVKRQFVRAKYHNHLMDEIHKLSSETGVPVSKLNGAYQNMVDQMIGIHHFEAVSKHFWWLLIIGAALFWTVKSMS